MPLPDHHTRQGTHVMRYLPALALAALIGLLAAQSPEVPDPIHRPNTVGAYR